MATTPFFGAPAQTATASAPSGVVVFSVQEGNVEDIHVANADGTGETNLTGDDNEYADHPAVAPDGSRIAYKSGDDLVVMRADGSDKVRVAGAGDSEIEWAPNSLMIAYGIGAIGIGVVNADGSHRREFRARPVGFSWAPDSRRIAFGTDDGLYVLDVVTGDAHRIVEIGRACCASWSPDGQTIAFGTIAQTDDRLYLVAPDGTGLRSLTSLGTNQTAVWHPSSRKLLVGARAPSRSVEVTVIDAASASITRLTETEGGEDSSSARWSADASAIVYLRGRYADSGGDEFSEADVWTMAADGSAKTEITHAFPREMSIGAPQWLSTSGRVDAVPKPRLPLVSVTAARTRTTVDAVRAVAGDDRRAALLPEGDYNSGTGFSDVAAIPVWDGASGRETRAPAGCAAFHPALAENRVAWSCAGFHESYLQVGDARGRRGTTIHATGPARTCLGGDAAGNGSLLVANGERIVCRVDGRSARLIFRDRLPLTVLSVRQRRVLVRRGRSQLLVLDATGRLIRSVRSGDPSLTAAAFSASRLVTAGRTLRVFDLRSGRRLHSWPIGPPGLPPQVSGVSGHITAYVSGDAIHLLNLDTGQDRVLEFPAQGGPAAASLTTAGLFYSYRRLHDPRPGIVGFVPARTLNALVR